MDISTKEPEALFEVQDFGDRITKDNGVWAYCKHTHLRDQMKVGETKYLDFQTGAGKDTIRVKRIQ